MQCNWLVKLMKFCTFSQSRGFETSQTKLPGTAGKLARQKRSDSVITVGAGSTAGIDVGAVEGTTYHRLHARRLGGAGVAIALSEEAALVAVADQDGQLHLWDIESKVPLASLQVTSSPLISLAVSPDGRRLALASSDGDIYELALDKNLWLAKACEIVRRELTASEWRPLVPDQSPKIVCNTVKAVN